MTWVVKRLLLTDLVKFGTYYSNKNYKLKGEKNEEKIFGNAIIRNHGIKLNRCKCHNY